MYRRISIIFCWLGLVSACQPDYIEPQDLYISDDGSPEAIKIVEWVVENNYDPLGQELFGQKILYLQGMYHDPDGFTAEDAVDGRHVVYCPAPGNKDVDLYNSFEYLPEDYKGTAAGGLHIGDDALLLEDRFEDIDYSFSSRCPKGLPEDEADIKGKNCRNFVSLYMDNLSHEIGHGLYDIGHVPGRGHVMSEFDGGHPVAHFTPLDYSAVCCEHVCTNSSDYPCSWEIL